MSYKFSVNEQNTHVIFYSSFHVYLKSICHNSLQIKYSYLFPKSSPPLHQVELYGQTNLLFIRVVDMYYIWDMSTNKILFRQSVPTLKEIRVSERYLAVCSEDRIEFLNIKTLCSRFTKDLKISYRMGCCSLSHWDQQTICAFQSNSSVVSVWKENQIANLRVSKRMVHHINVSKRLDILLIAHPSFIVLYNLADFNNIVQLRAFHNFPLKEFKFSSFTSEKCCLTDINNMTICLSYYDCTQNSAILHDNGLYISNGTCIFFITTTGIIKLIEIVKI